MVAIKSIVNPSTNSLDGLIPSLMSLCRARSVNYKSNIIISFVINYNSNTKLDLFYITTRSGLSNLGISDCEDLRSRKKRKPNFTIMTYYYRYLGYSNNIL